MYLPVSRGTSLKLGWTMVILGLLIMPDIIVPTFTDILNFLIAMPISSIMGIEYTTALIGTWIFGVVLFLLGVLVLPYNNGVFLRARITGAYRMFMARPWMIAIMIASVFIMWHIADWVYISIYPELESYALQTYDQYKYIIGM